MNISHNISTLDRNRAIYLCHVCGSAFNWNDQSAWYGSYHDMENKSENVKYLCCNKCKQEFETNPKKNKTMKTTQIEKILLQNLADRSFPVYLTKYMNQGFNEADVFGISGSGHMYEYEIKISRSDFLADFKNKQYKHRLLSSKEAVHTYAKWYKGKKTGETYDQICLPNRFYYACPKGLIDVSELPEYAGLIYIDNGKYVEVKPAPLLHKHKANEVIYKNIATILSQRVEWGCAYMSYKQKEKEKWFETVNKE